MNTEITLTVCRNIKTDKLSMRRSDGRTVEYLCVDGHFVDERYADERGVFEWEDSRQPTPEAATVDSTKLETMPYVCSSFHREVMYYGQGCPMCEIQEAMYCAAHPPKPPAEWMALSKQLAKEIQLAYSRMAIKHQEMVELTQQELLAVIAPIMQKHYSAPAGNENDK